jgi:hypothetical protein
VEVKAEDTPAVEADVKENKEDDDNRGSKKKGKGNKKKTVKN